MFRSELERVVADGLDALGLPWEYEPTALAARHAATHVPDFWLPSPSRCWLEVRGYRSAGLRDERAFADLAVSQGEAYLFLALRRVGRDDWARGPEGDGAPALLELNGDALALGVVDRQSHALTEAPHTLCHLLRLVPAGLTVRVGALWVQADTFAEWRHRLHETAPRHD